MYKNILVTVAYEAEHDATPSLEIAKALADPDARLTLMHVMEPAPVFALNYMPEGWQEDLRRAIEADLGRLAGPLGQDVSIVVTEGDPAHEVLEHARAQRVDCIVVASHRPGTQSLLLGSTASKIVGRAQCSVHVARRK